MGNFAEPGNCLECQQRVKIQSYYNEIFHGAVMVFIFFPQWGNFPGLPRQITVILGLLQQFLHGWEEGPAISEC